MMRVVRTLLMIVASFVLARSIAGAAEQPIPPMPSHWATDTAGFLSAATVAQLDGELRNYEQRTGHQVLLYVAPTTGDTPLEDWTVRAFAQWKVGRKGLDDGLVLFVFSRDRAVRIEVGYGLEATVPDAIASRIIRETIIPRLRAGDPDGAVLSGVHRILSVIGGAGPSAPSPAAVDEAPGTSQAPLDPLALVVVGILLFSFVIVAIRSPWFALILLSLIHI